jgi:hypothetical protein
MSKLLSALSILLLINGCYYYYPANVNHNQLQIKQNQYVSCVYYQIGWYGHLNCL